MIHPGKVFYEQWAERQLKDTRRAMVLKWKAANLANLALRTLRNVPMRSICEIGGAEGIVLDAAAQLLGVQELVNYELSSEFCAVGRRQFPGIEFINAEFGAQGPAYDLIILSDIIEHVEDDDTFLAAVSQRCRYVVLKIPIEKCLSNTALFYRLRGRLRPPELNYGPHHINGHLRGYTLQDAKRAVAKHFTIIDTQASDVLYFYGTAKQRLLKHVIGAHASIWIFGGALFVLGQSERYRDE